MKRIIVVACAVLLCGCDGDTRQQRWDKQSGAERIRDGVRNPRNHPPGRGFNTSDRVALRRRREAVA